MRARTATMDGSRSCPCLGLGWIAIAVLASCTERESPPAIAQTPAPSAVPSAPRVKNPGLPFEADASRDYPCNQVIGTTVAGEWFPGFEAALDGDKWQAVVSDDGDVETWADPKSAMWATVPISKCADSWGDLDRVLFVASSSKPLTVEAWTNALIQVVQNLRGKHIHLKRVELATWLRPPNDRACRGNAQSVVPPSLDEAIARVVAAFPRLVVAAPKAYAPSCKVFQKGGPHLTDAGKGIAGKLYAEPYARDGG